VSLSAEVIGVPLPTVIWSKDGQQLVAPASGGSPHYRVHSDGGHLSLQFDRVMSTDAGWYQCTAMNSAGTATSRAKLSVQTTTVPRTYTTAAAAAATATTTTPIAAALVNFASC